MNEIRRLKYSIRHFGLRASLLKILLLVIDLYFDNKYGTNTTRPIRLRDLTIKSCNKKKGVNYQATRVKPLRVLFNKIQLMIPPDSRFVDLGCGKGRALLIASQFGFNEAVGVEFSSELCTIANNNCDVYKAKTSTDTKFKIIESDVVDYRIKKNDNIFFMYNPFKEVVLGKVLNNITSSLKKFNRPALIIYCNPKYGYLIETHDSFVKSGDFTIAGFEFSIYSNTM